MSTPRAPAPSMPEHVNTGVRHDSTRRAVLTRSGVPDPAPAISAPAAPARPAGSPLGQLVDETPDAMTLHTQDAYRMFTGRAADPASNAPPIPGGRRFAAVLKAIWYLSANDNPTPTGS